MPQTLFFCRNCDNTIGKADLVQPFRPGMPAMPADDLVDMDERTHWAIALNLYTTGGGVITPHNKYGTGGKIRRIAKVWCNNCNLNLGNLQEAHNSRTTAEPDLENRPDVYHFLKIANVTYSTSIGPLGARRAIDGDRDMELKWLSDSNLHNEQFHEAFVAWHLQHYKKRLSRALRRPYTTYPLRSYLDDRGLSLVPPADPFEGNVVVETIELPATSAAPVEAPDDVARKTKEEDEQIADAVMMAVQMNYEERSAELAVEREAADPKDAKDTETEQPDEQPDDVASEASAFTLPSADDGAKADLERQLAGMRAASEADAKTDLLRQLEDLRVAVDRLTAATVAVLARA